MTHIQSMLIAVSQVVFSCLFEMRGKPVILATLSCDAVARNTSGTVRKSSARKSALGGIGQCSSGHSVLGAVRSGSNRLDRAAAATIIVPQPVVPLTMAATLGVRA